MYKISAVLHKALGSFSPLEARAWSVYQEGNNVSLQAGGLVGWPNLCLCNPGTLMLSGGGGGRANRVRERVSHPEKTPNLPYKGLRTDGPVLYLET